MGISAVLHVRTLLILLFGAMLSGCYPASDFFEEAEADLDGKSNYVAEPARHVIDWSGEEDCRGKLALLERALSSGDIDGLEDTPFSLLDDRPALYSAGWSSGQVPGLTQADGNDAGGAKPCVIRLGRIEGHQANHRVLGHERVRSSYQSGTHREKNPAYEAAQARLRQAERASKPGKSSIVSVGDPLIDLVGTLIGGAITGVSQWGEVDPVEEAIDALMATPRSIEQPVYKPYDFERTRIRVNREAVIPVVLTDRSKARRWRTSLRRRELKEISVLEGLDRQDRDYSSHRENSMTDQEFRRWLEEPPEVPLEDMIASLLIAPPVTFDDRMATVETRTNGRAAAGDETGFDLDGSLDAAIVPSKVQERPIAAAAQPSWPVQAYGAPLLPSVIQLRRGDHLGDAVHVTSAMVLTTSDLVEGAGLIDVEDEAGGRVLGLVAAVDRDLGLALVQVPRPGTPAVLNQGQAHIAETASSFERYLGNGSPRDANGQFVAQEWQSDSEGPILRGRFLVGFRSAHGAVIQVREIRDFLNKQEEILAQN